jgi:hypothetical protein
MERVFTQIEKETNIVVIGSMGKGMGLDRTPAVMAASMLASGKMINGMAKEQKQGMEQSSWECGVKTRNMAKERVQILAVQRLLGFGEKEI